MYLFSSKAIIKRRSGRRRKREISSTLFKPANYTRGVPLGGCEITLGPGIKILKNTMIYVPREPSFCFASSFVRSSAIGGVSMPMLLRWPAHSSAEMHFLYTILQSLLLLSDISPVPFTVPLSVGRPNITHAATANATPTIVNTLEGIFLGCPLLRNS